jgi:hypothetical protein
MMTARVRTPILKMMHEETTYFKNIIIAAQRINYQPHNKTQNCQQKHIG